MASSIKVGNVPEALQARRFPTVTMFNRLEGRPRTVAFDQALQAEVRDPLWMLTKQWQMGEFRGADAGSAVFARMMLDVTQLSKYRPGGHATEAFPQQIPLETQVERRTLATHAAGHSITFDLRLSFGRYWLKLIAKLSNDYSSDFIGAYPVLKPNPDDILQADRCAHLESWQMFEATAGRAMDGIALFEYLTAQSTNHAYDNIPTISPGDHSALDDLANRFIASVNRTISTPPTEDDAWIPEHLEYQFAASAPLPDGTEKVYVAEEYYRGHLDWYSVDTDSEITTLGPVADAPAPSITSMVRTMIPTPVSFSGMPNTRWWAFEDQATNFGDISASTTDLAKLLFMEFALVYANDWFIFPYTLPVGTIANVAALVVTNVFGDRQWIPAAGSGVQSNWQRWSLFTVAGQDPGSPGDRSLLMLPTAPHIQESELLEDVLLIRDEAANMVWGIEKTVLLSTGEPKRGIEVAREALAFYERIVKGEGSTSSPPPAVAPIRYELMTSVPENWIPFIPVHVDPGNNRDIQLQRAALPRNIGNDPTDLPLSLRKVEPRTQLLREGLDNINPSRYFVFEEEVPRAGARVYQRYQRTRWIGGAAHVWLRVRKDVGRGEGSSGLAFDTLEQSPQASTAAP
jgi:hypothetical protein